MVITNSNTKPVNYIHFVLIGPCYCTYLLLQILFAVRHEKEAGVIIADVEAAETSIHSNAFLILRLPTCNVFCFNDSQSSCSMAATVVENTLLSPSLDHL